MRDDPARPAYAAAAAIALVQFPQVRHYPADLAAGAFIASEALVAIATPLIWRRVEDDVSSVGHSRSVRGGSGRRASRTSARPAERDLVGDKLVSGRTIVVFGGGNALGAYHAGAYEQIGRRGLEPCWIVGASIGAITGAILAGNPPEHRLERLGAFWDEATIRSPLAPDGPEKLRQYYNGWHAAWTALVGRPSIFRHRWPGFWAALPGTPNDVALYDHAPLRATLDRLVDFDYLQRSEIRLSILCVDVETGDEVVFDSGRDRIGPEHVLASTAITPSFPPVVIDGRMLCDPGYVNNTPVDIALADPPDRDTLCIAIELFGLRSPRPASLDAVLERTQDIMFASPTRRTVAALTREYGLRSELARDTPAVTLLHLVYQAAGHELAAKTLDFSPSSIADRWAAGLADLGAGLDRLTDAPSRPGLTYVVADPTG